MIGLGGYNPFPLTLGGGEATLEIEHLNLLNRLSPGWDSDSSETMWAEAYADAMAVTIIWAINNRLKNQTKPERMLETLTTWEEACNSNPMPGASDPDRRRALAAKLRATANNALGDIEDACSKILGVNFVRLVIVDPDDVVTYWPGVNPGPPGFEWSSNRALIGIQMNTVDLTNKLLAMKRAQLVKQLDAMCPVWMRFAIGTDTEFIAGVGIVGRTFL